MISHPRCPYVRYTRLRIMKLLDFQATDPEHRGSIRCIRRANHRGQDHLWPARSEDR